MMAVRPRSPVEIRREGFKALVERLGPSDAIRFLHQYEQGRGDYTAERHQWLDRLTLEGAVHGIEALRKDKDRPPQAAGPGREAKKKTRAAKKRPTQPHGQRARS